MTRLKRSDVELAYELAGQGPPALLIQGVGVAGSTWRPQVSGLQRDFTTLAFDNRGFGQSLPCTGEITIEQMSGDVAALMDAAGWASAHVIGHSMGGVIAQQFALEAPQRVRSLSLLCTFSRAKDAARLTPWVLWMTLRTRVGTRAMRRNAFLEMLFPRAELDRCNLTELAATTSELVGRDLADSPPIILNQVRALARHDASGRLGELASIPTLVQSAEFDRIAHPKYGRDLGGRIPGARFDLIAGASHAVTIQKAKTVNESLRRHLIAAEGLGRRSRPIASLASS